MINTILDLQRLQEGKLPLMRTSIDLGAVLHNSVEEFYSWARRDGKGLHLDVASNIPRISADVDVLQRIMANLLSNALKHTPEGTKVRVSAFLDSSPGLVVLTVSDNGPGIAPELLAQLFNRYTRGDGFKVGGSSGLGLTFCKLAVEAHGGAISVTSELGVGVTFKVLLPLFPLAAPPPTKAEQAVGATKIAIAE